jgi:hypothetical protein
MYTIFSNWPLLYSVMHVFSPVYFFFVKPRRYLTTSILLFQPKELTSLNIVASICLVCLFCDYHNLLLYLVIVSKEMGFICEGYMYNFLHVIIQTFIHFILSPTIEFMRSCITCTCLYFLYARRVADFLCYGVVLPCVSPSIRDHFTVFRIVCHLCSYCIETWCIVLQ